MTDPTPEEAIRRARELQAARRHDEAAATLEPWLASNPDNHELHKTLALIYGGKVELQMARADRTGAIPSTLELAELTRLLGRAIELDPQLGDVHWDLAVIRARFLLDYEGAETALARAKSIGYSHPMMPRLEALLRQRSHPQQPPPSPPPFVELVTQLLAQASGPEAAALFERTELNGPPTFEQLLARGCALATEGALDRNDFMHAFALAARANGDASEIALDLLRGVAAALRDAELEGIAGHAQLSILARMSQYFGGVQPVDAHSVLKARRIARRALAIIEHAGFVVKPAVHGEVMIALGQSYARPEQGNFAHALEAYLQAWRLKGAAGEDASKAGLSALIERMVEHQIKQTTMALVLGGLGEALRDMQLGHDAALALGDAELVHKSGLALAEAQGRASQPQLAADLLQTLLARGDASAELNLAERFTLAARLSETHTPDSIRRARELGEEVVAELELPAGRALNPATAWMNLGNYRRLDRDPRAARAAFEAALTHCATPAPNEIPLQRGQIKMLLAEVEVLVGERDAAIAHLGQAEADFEHGHGYTRMHFESLATRLWLELGDANKAARHADRGIAMRTLLLAHKPTPEVWASTLGEWTRLDGYAVVETSASAARTGSRKRC